MDKGNLFLGNKYNGKTLDFVRSQKVLGLNPDTTCSWESLLSYFVSLFCTVGVVILLSHGCGLRIEDCRR